MEAFQEVLLQMEKLSQYCTLTKNTLTKLFQEEEHDMQLDYLPRTLLMDLKNRLTIFL
jgi:hypothetical protein